MRNFFKKVAFVVAFAMVLAGLGPAASARASASPAPSLRFGSIVLYVNDNGDEFASKIEPTRKNWCWTPSQNITGYTLTYSTSSTIVNVSRTGRITANGSGIGAAVVRVTFTDNATGRASGADFTVRVRRNATAVKLREAVERRLEEAVTAGSEPIGLSAAKTYAADGRFTPASKVGFDNFRGVISDQVDYAVTNPADREVVRLAQDEAGAYSLVPVSSGEATLRVYTHQYLDASKAQVVYKDYTITVAGATITATQQTVSHLQVEMSDVFADVKDTDFTITRVEDSVVVTIKSATVAANNKRLVTLETFNPISDGADYTVSYKLKDEELTANFTAAKYEVARMVPNHDKIPFNFPTLISVDLLDVNGVVLDTVTDSVSANKSVEWEILDWKGAFADDRLTLYARGDKERFRVTYRSYDANNQEVLLPIEFTVEAIDSLPNLEYRTLISGGSGDVSGFNWKDKTASDRVESIIAESEGFLHLFAVDENGDVVSNELFGSFDFKVESTDESVLIVYDGMGSEYNVSQTFKEVNNGRYFTLYAVKAGTVFLNIRNSEGRLAKQIRVTVRAVRELRDFNLDRTTATVSNASDAPGAAFVVTPIDQYGETANVDNRTLVRVEEAPNSSNETGATWPKLGDNGRSDGKVSVNVSGVGADPGTYRYKVTMTIQGTEKSRYVSVVVREPAGSDRFEIHFGGQDNLKYEGSDRNREIKVAHFKGNLFYQYLTFGEVSNEYYVSEIQINNGSDRDTLLVANIGNFAAAGNDNDGLVNADVNARYTDVENGKAFLDITGWNTKTLLYQIATTTASISGTSVSGSVVKKTNTGTRSVKVTINRPNDKPMTATAQFTINDGQESMTATTDRTTFRNNNDDTLETLLRTNLIFNYDGKELNKSFADFNKVVIYRVRVGNRWYKGLDSISKVLADLKQLAPTTNPDRFSVNAIEIAYNRGGTYFVLYQVSINRTFIIN